jgi:hypothetical protein
MQTPHTPDILSVPQTPETIRKSFDSVKPSILSIPNSRRKVISPILEQPVSRGRKEVSLSAFSFLFSEIIQYFQGRVTQVKELEEK